MDVADQWRLASAQMPASQQLDPSRARMPTCFSTGRNALRAARHSAPQGNSMRLQGLGTCCRNLLWRVYWCAARQALVALRPGHRRSCKPSWVDATCDAVTLRLRGPKSSHQNTDRAGSWIRRIRSSFSCRRDARPLMIPKDTLQFPRRPWHPATAIPRSVRGRCGETVWVNVSSLDPCHLPNINPAIDPTLVMGAALAGTCPACAQNCGHLKLHSCPHGVGRD